ncbi:MAG TPA: hypothetical protein DIT31_13075, partial [Methylophaga sp.]|nr:hypothetical protein [Methylophaga sp.]
MQQQNKTFQLPIRTAVVAGLMLSSLLVAVVIIALQYYFNKNLAEKTLHSRYQQTKASVNEYLESIDNRATNEINEL